jgi:hypothetical protein
MVTTDGGAPDRHRNDIVRKKNRCGFGILAISARQRRPPSCGQPHRRTYARFFARLPFHTQFVIAFGIIAGLMFSATCMLAQFLAATSRQFNKFLLVLKDEFSRSKS